MEENLYELLWQRPMNGAVFKCLLGKHADIFTPFLKAFWTYRWMSVKALNIDINQHYDRESKLTILDLKIETKTEKRIDIDIQILIVNSLV